MKHYIKYISTGAVLLMMFLCYNPGANAQAIKTNAPFS